jgi:hypothetical protein
MLDEDVVEVDITWFDLYPVDDEEALRPGDSIEDPAVVSNSKLDGCVEALILLPKQLRYSVTINFLPQ